MSTRQASSRCSPPVLHFETQILHSVPNRNAVSGHGHLLGLAGKELYLTQRRAGSAQLMGSIHLISHGHSNHSDMRAATNVAEMAFRLGTVFAFLPQHASRCARWTKQCHDSPVRCPCGTRGDGLRYQRRQFEPSAASHQRECLAVNGLGLSRRNTAIYGHGERHHQRRYELERQRSPKREPHRGHNFEYGALYGAAGSALARDAGDYGCQRSRSDEKRRRCGHGQERLNRQRLASHRQCGTRRDPAVPCQHHRLG
jgi:hypothetical protein